MKQYDYIIGIDTGTKTGYSVWNCKTRSLEAVSCIPIHLAMELVRDAAKRATIKVKFEDARQVRFNTDYHKAQGAGSVKRDAAIWEGYLSYLGVDFEAVRPKKSLTKWDADYFKRVTGWQGKTNSHGRDAALIIFNYN